MPLHISSHLPALVHFRGSPILMATPPTNDPLKRLGEDDFRKQVKRLDEGLNQHGLATQPVPVGDDPKATGEDVIPIIVIDPTFHPPDDNPGDNDITSNLPE